MSMKLAICLLMLLPSIMFGQVHKFRAFEGKTALWNGSDWGQDVSQQGINILVVMNLDKMKIKTYGESEGDYDLVRKLSQTSDQESVTASYRAVDSVGDECSVVFQKYYSPKVTKSGGLCSAMLEVIYKKILLVFYLKPDDQ